MTISVDDLEAILPASWSKDTSADRRAWSLQNAAWGQCAVTTLVVQDLLGGEILRAEINGVSHYWNRLPNGAELDLTIAQFGKHAPAKLDSERRSREYLLRSRGTRRRYTALRARVDELITRRRGSEEAIQAASSG